MPTFENPMKNYQSVITTFDLSKMQSDINNYNDRLIHPLHYSLEFVSRDGAEKVALSVGQLAIITAIIAKYPSPGKAIDRLFSGLEQDQTKDICGKF